jgi:hypothetical protein
MPGQIELIGVYALPVDDELVRAQAEILYGQRAAATDLAHTRAQLESAVLFEALVSGADADFDVGDFAQEDPQLPRDTWQAAWAEAYLSPDGEELLAERGGSPSPGQLNFRIAFYMHYWKPGQPLFSSYGPLATPPPSRMPERLKRLAPYEFVD